MVFGNPRLIACALFAALSTLAQPATAQTTLFFDNFESGTSHWTSSGLWHWIRDTNSCAGPAVPFPSATHCMWYGIDGQCNYDDGQSNAGMLRMNDPVHLPVNGQTATLRFRDWREGEVCGTPGGAPYDTSAVWASIDDGQSWQFLRYECEPHFTWRKGRADLTPYMGRDVVVGFTFDTLDNAQNDFRGWMIDDVALQLEAGRSYCEVDGPCPCATPTGAPPYNVGGCMNSASTVVGAELWSSGIPSLLNDNVVLRVSDMPPNAPVLFLQGSVMGNSLPFGDGVRCIGAPFVRLGTKTAVAGSAVFPGPLDFPLSLLGLIGLPGPRAYQAYYRDLPQFCTAATFNLSNGYMIQWLL